LYEVRLADGVAPGTPIGSATVKWAGVTDGRPHEATAELVAADPEAAPTRSLMLASIVADLAESLKDAEDLSGLRDRAGAVGADELVRLIDEAEVARLYKR
jgi:hypothetical protein